MLTTYTVRDGTLSVREGERDPGALREAVWLDMLMPSPEEERAVQAALGLEIPTREEMQEIEPTSRLYVENGARYMTITLMCRSDTDEPTTTAVTFILVGRRLVTVRYDEPRSFVIAGSRLARQCAADITGEGILMELLETIIDRGADLLEHIGSDIDALSKDIFQSERTGRERVRAQDLLRAISRKGDLTARVRECLVSIERMLLYLASEANGTGWSKDRRAVLRGMHRDVQALSDHSTFLSSKISFLLDALLGFVSIEQNNVIKIFTVAAVVFMPPTLIASIYGMNFRHMPELEFWLGYPMALALMALSVGVMYALFKAKNWL